MLPPAWIGGSSVERLLNLVLGVCGALEGLESAWVMGIWNAEHLAIRCCRDLAV